MKHKISEVVMEHSIKFANWIKDNGLCSISGKDCTFWKSRMDLSLKNFTTEELYSLFSSGAKGLK